MIIGGVLAGGASRRMGRDKALVEVGGRTMLERVAGALGGAVDRVVLAGRPGAAGLEGVPDPPHGAAGPLAGLVALLGLADRIGAAAVLVVAVDQAFVRGSTLARLAGMFEADAVVPEADGIRQVTCAVYPAAWLGEASAELRAGGSIQTLLDRMPHTLVGPEQWARWDEDGASWFSVDDPAAMEEGLARFGGAGGSGAE